MRSLSIAWKLASLLILAGFLSSAAVLASYFWSLNDAEHELAKPLTRRAAAVNDIIDRNLFERYGDVQAFASNPYLRTESYWQAGDQATPLSDTIDTYTRLYGIYDAMLLVDTSGIIRVTNRHQADGSPMKASLIGQSVAETQWFTDAMAGKFLVGKDGTTGTAVTGPFWSPIVKTIHGGDGLSLVFSAPVIVDGKVIGVWANFLDFSVIDSIVLEAQQGLITQGLSEAEVTLLDDTGTIWVDGQPGTTPKSYKHDPKILGQLNLAKAGVEAAQKAITEKSGLIQSLHARRQIMQYAGYSHSEGFMGYPGLKWSVLVRVPVKGAFAVIEHQKTLMITAAAAALLLTLLAGVITGRWAVKPLQRISQTLRSLAKGDIPPRFEINGKDELEQMKEASNALRREVRMAFQMRRMIDQMPINVMVCDPKDVKIAYMNDAARSVLKSLQPLLPCPVDEMMGRSIDMFHKHPEHQRRLLADPSNLPHKTRIRLGPESMDLLVNPVRDRDGTYIAAMLTWSVVTQSVQLADTFERDVLKMVQDVTSAAAAQANGVEHLAHNAHEVDAQACEVNSATEQMSANVQTVASATEELSASINEISGQVANAATIAQQALDETRSSSDTVSALQESAARIGEVVGLIETIAAQTNLLALNATIEAARAGEAGKGFAVVANEVKTLATQTARATAEITQQIAAVQDQTTRAAGAMAGIASIIERVSEISNVIAAAVEEQAAATREIAHNVQLTAVHTQTAADGVSTVREAVAQTSAVVSDMAQSSEALEQDAASLKKSVEIFLSHIRAI